MNPSTISIILHAGLLIGTAKDIVKGIQDLVAKHPSPDDAKAILNDLVNVLKSGLVSIPGVSADQAAAVVSDIELALGISPQAVS